METSRLCLVVLVSVSIVSETIAALDITPHPEFVARNQKMCTDLAKDPYFEPEMVVGYTWRVYYTWEMNVEPLCIDIKFKLATPSIIRRFYFEMHERLKEQPAWGAASLVLNMGKFQKEMLLFDDQGPAGKFVAVVNMLRDPSHIRSVESPLLKFQVKLVRNGKYLMFMDCQVGAASLLARADQPPDRAEIESVAASFSPLLGEGFNACLEKKDLATP